MSIKKFAAILASVVLLSWPGNFGSTNLACAAAQQLTPESEDVLSHSKRTFEVYVLGGLTAKRLYKQFGSLTLLDLEHSVVLILRIEA